MDNLFVGATSPPFQLLQLPVEIVVSILGNLPWRSLLPLSLCCRFLRTIIQETTSLQYRISLGAINSSERGDLPQFNVHERLDELRRRESAWATLQWHRRGTVDLAPDSGVYELQHGIFIQGIRDAGASVSAQSNGVRIMPLPHSATTISSEVAESEFTPEEYGLGFDFADFNIDPEQNLAVYACFGVLDDPESTLQAHIRIRQLSGGGKAYPRARAERLDLRPTTRGGLMFNIQIFGDFVGILTRSILGGPDGRDSEFFLYNWQTGTLQTRCKHPHVDGFIFLSPYYFILVSSKEPAGFLVYYFQPRRVVGLAPPPKPPRCVVTYLLPEMYTTAVGMADLTCRCEPTPIFEPPNYVTEGSFDAGYATSSPEMEIAHPRLVTVPYPGSSPAVRPSQDDFRLAVLSFRVGHEAFQEKLLGFVVISELFKHAQRRSASFVDSEGRFLDDGQSSCQRLQWEEWGPRWTRFMQGTVSRSWVCYVYMTRFVFMASEPPMDAMMGGVSEDADERRGYIGVLDFNPHGLRESYPARSGAWPRSVASLNSIGHFASSADPRAGSVPQACKTFDHIRPITVGGLLFKPLKSCLPFRRFSSYQPFNRVVDPMIDAERILMVEEDEEGRLSALQVLAL